MTLPQPNDNRKLFLDMNAFFASCEQFRRPELRGRPVAVTPTPCPSGCVIAASYEAKQRGVSTGCRVGEAMRRIPGVAVVTSDPRYYVQIHRRIAQVIATITPFATAESIDEFAIAISPLDRDDTRALAFARQLKAALANAFDPMLTCSIGIGPNRFLAKLGTELQKPNGLVHIHLSDLPTLYEPINLRTLPGINHGLEKRLWLIGIRSTGEFYAAPATRLRQGLGIIGEAWWHRLHGYEVDRVRLDRPKSVSHSHVLSPETRPRDRAWGTVHKLLEKVMHRLRDHDLGSYELALFLRSDRGDRWRWQYHLNAAQSAQPVVSWLRTDYAKLPRHARILKCTIVATQLEAPMPQLPLFPTDDRYRRRDHAIDTINAKHGRWTVQPASLFAASSAAPNRISFGTIDYEMD